MFGAPGLRNFVKFFKHGVRVFSPRCYANSTNKTIAAPRANNWDEVYELVHAQAKNVVSRNSPVGA